MGLLKPVRNRRRSNTVVKHDFEQNLMLTNKAAYKNRRIPGEVDHKNNDLILENKIERDEKIQELKIKLRQAQNNNRILEDRLKNCHKLQRENRRLWKENVTFRKANDRLAGQLQDANQQIVDLKSIIGQPEGKGECKEAESPEGDLEFN